MKNKTYEEFTEKFKPKKTTDDCYTPSLVYEAVADWVANEYNIDRSVFVHPFYPGGDYEKFDYTNKIVVDNPPFSILSQIIRFYVQKNIKFFMFAPTLTLCRYGDYCTVLPIGVSIIYDNGAVVNTSFATNLEPFEIRARTSPSLFETVKKANEENRRSIKKQLPKYVYPLELVTPANIYPYARYGIDFVIPRSESVRVSALDEQRQNKKAIFGGGWLISKRLKAERKEAERKEAEQLKAERLKVEFWKLSEREKAIIASLDN